MNWRKLDEHYHSFIHPSVSWRLRGCDQGLPWLPHHDGLHSWSVSQNKPFLPKAVFHQDILSQWQELSPSKTAIHLGFWGRASTHWGLGLSDWAGLFGHWVPRVLLSLPDRKMNNLKWLVRRQRGLGHYGLHVSLRNKWFIMVHCVVTKSSQPGDGVWQEQLSIKWNACLQLETAHCLSKEQCR